MGGLETLSRGAFWEIRDNLNGLLHVATFDTSEGKGYLKRRGGARNDASSQHFAYHLHFCAQGPSAVTEQPRRGDDVIAVETLVG